MFKSICDELAEWIKEKKNALAAGDSMAGNLKGIQALQRRHAVSLKKNLFYKTCHIKLKLLHLTFTFVFCGQTNKHHENVNSVKIFMKCICI